ncbi:MAG: energy transducer TonB family protein [Pseudobdellovibrionaceae bacterium]
MSFNHFKKSILLSLFLHAGLFLLMLLLKPISGPQNSPKNITVDLLEPAQIKKFKEPVSQQIVEQEDRSVNEEVPDKAKYLSAKNQAVKKETVAQQLGSFQNKKMQSKAGKPQAQKLAHPQFNPKSLFVGIDPLSSFKNKKTDNNIESKTKPMKADQGQQGQDISQTQDHLKDVDKGLETLLNTREFKYYSYYNRIRRQLTEYWEPNVRSKMTKMFREGRAPAAQLDRITKLVVILNKSGHLVKVQVLGPSGVRDLDDAAIEAFRSAAPFPNPPMGIIDTDGTVKIRWDFILES